MTNYAPKTGDRVRVVFEGVYDEDHPSGGPVLDLSGDGQAYGTMPIDLGTAASVEILPPPEPPVGTVMIGFDGEVHRSGTDTPYVFCREVDDNEGWRITGTVGKYIYAQLFELTRVDRQVIPRKTP